MEKKELKKTCFIPKFKIGDTVYATDGFSYIETKIDDIWFRVSNSKIYYYVPRDERICNRVEFAEDTVGTNLFVDESGAKAVVKATEDYNLKYREEELKQYLEDFRKEKGKEYFSKFISKLN